MSHKITILFEYYANTLAENLASRVATNNYFSEKELWQLAESLLTALDYMQNNEISHEDICPKNILISNTGEYKIGDYGLLINGLSGYFRLVSDKTNDCYLSPKLVAALDNKVLDPNHNKYKSDVFSLGMTLIYASTLKSVENCYDLTLF